MPVSTLPSGKVRALVYDPSAKDGAGANVSVGPILGLPTSTFDGKRAARAAVAEAAKIIAERGRVEQAGLTVAEWRERWLHDARFAPPKANTTRNNHYSTKRFAEQFGHLPLDEVDDDVAAAWLAGPPSNLGYVNRIRAMLNVARSPLAGRVMRAPNPFAALGLAAPVGNARTEPPTEERVGALIEAMRRLSGPSPAALLTVAAYSGCRPGELFALKWTDLDLDAGRMRIERQWNSAVQQFTTPKNGKARDALLTPPARDALLALARDPRSEFVFVNRRGLHWRMRAFTHHWDAARVAVGHDQTLYVSTRHFAGSYMTNALHLDAEDVAFALGHEDGGELVRKLYGHKSRRQALDRVAAAYAAVAEREREEGAAVRHLRAV